MGHYENYGKWGSRYVRDWKDKAEDILMNPFVFITLLIVVLILVFAVLPFWALNTASCNGYKDLNPKDEVRFTWSMGCMVKQNGQWVTIGTATTNQRNINVK